jgi:Mg2+/citrate symporter
LTQAVSFFFIYVLAAGAIVTSVFQRSSVLRLVLKSVTHLCPNLSTRFIRDEIVSAKSVPAGFFCKHDDLYVINKALLYVTVSRGWGRTGRRHRVQRSAIFVPC